jgi:PiT family inorganic phosphate transporter
MQTVGSKIVTLDPFSALVVLVAEAVTVHFYSFVGVPVSTSQAIIGAVLGIGILRGVNTVNRPTMIGVFMGWFFTPFMAGSLSVALDFLIHLKYVPN